ncbi:hypothetical protein RRG08_021620 [Elysia crispata]|uniref:Uncharacterized protein n=1 Tax=Elysia crispata TaxID=231223 RepID=A0AAE0XDZ7_9GAST|nr:hypothetical protein RRG08_021620 [Elysia crispata]
MAKKPSRLYVQTSIEHNGSNQNPSGCSTVKIKPTPPTTTAQLESRINRSCVLVRCSRANQGSTDPVSWLGAPERIKDQQILCPG